MRWAALAVLLAATVPVAADDAELRLLRAQVKMLTQQVAQQHRTIAALKDEIARLKAGPTTRPATRPATQPATRPTTRGLVPFHSMPPRVRAYFQEAARQNAARMAPLRRQVQAITNTINAAKVGKIKPRNRRKVWRHDRGYEFQSRQARSEFVEAFEAQLRAVSADLARLEAVIPGVDIAGILQDREVGAIGALSGRGNVRIIQIINENTMLVGLGREAVMMVGWSTQGRVDDQFLRQALLGEIDGTTTYTTTTGATRTVFRMVPFDPKQYLRPRPETRPSMP